MPTTNAGFADAPGIRGRIALATHGPTLNVQVGFDPNFEPTSGERPQLPENPWPALVDTGAALSCVDSVLATHLGLPIVDREPVAGAHGAQDVNVHVAQMFVPELQATILGRFHAVHLSAGGQPHSALIGRSFLMDFTMVYEGKTGTVTISNE